MSEQGRINGWSGRQPEGTGAVADQIGMRFRERLRNIDIERDRWFLWTPVVLGLGTATYFRLPAEPDARVVAAVFIAAAAIHAVFRTHILRLFSIVLVILVLGAALAKLRTELVRGPVLEREIRNATVEGVVETVEPRDRGTARIALFVTALSGIAEAERPHRVRIYLTGFEGQVWPGDGLRLRARLGPPAEPILPGGYDFARAAFFRGLGGVGFSRGPPEKINPGSGVPWSVRVSAHIQAFRRGIGERVRAAIPGETGAIANALMTGERAGISEETNTAYRDAGIFHILSISGLHMAIMGGAVFFAIRFGLAALPSIALRYPIKKWAAIAAVVAAFGYLLISGGAFATVRSFIMIAIMFLAIVLDRPAIALRNVALAALMILLVVPESLFDIGFQMSFAAVAALVGGYEWVRHRHEQARITAGASVQRGRWFGARVASFAVGIIGTTLLAGLAVAPLSAFHFHTSQQYSVLTNLIAVPISNFVVMPAALAAFVAMPFGGEAVPLAVMGWGVDLMTWCARKVASLPGAVLAVPAFSETALLMMVFGGLWLILWRRRWRYLGLAGIAIGIVLAILSVRPDMLIGADGRLVAVRGADGRLSALPAPRTRFELSRWLEYDGDTRDPKEALKRTAFRCDLLGCTVRLGERLVAVSRSPAALGDDCQRADILVLSMPRPQNCSGPRRVFDFYALRNGGTHAVYLEQDGRLRIKTVAQWRGQRPWTRRLVERRPRKSRVGVSGQRLNMTEMPAGQRAPATRYEIEDGRPLYWSR